MNPMLVSILAQIAAAQARVAGMQTANEASRLMGDVPVYAIDAFAMEADQLDRLAVVARDYQP